jgi:glutamate-1-semialdehyde 2,1-aminomutase
MNLNESAKWYQRACKVIPAGVSSPVRAFQAVGGNPIYLRSGSGAHVEDIDGNTFLDFVMSWGPLIHGHAHPKIIEKVTRAALRGTSFGTPCIDEVKLAELISKCYPASEKLRFVSSGTEAVMSAIRLARGYTQNDLIIKFNGCYHGHVDSLLVEAGSGLATFGRPSSLGIPDCLAAQTITLPLNNIDLVSKAFNNHPGKIAAIIIEPIPANNGLLIQDASFIKSLRELCDSHKSLLIFDEVISGFRVGPAGASSIYDVKPDLITFGKVIGGGLPAGAFGGAATIMDHIAPLGGVYQAGTLSGNPLAMAAGLASIELLLEHDGWNALEKLGLSLEEKMSRLTRKVSWDISFVRKGSIFWLSLGSSQPPKTSEAITASSKDKYNEIFHGLLKRNIYIAPSMYEVGFLSTSHTPLDIEVFTEALEDLFHEKGWL